MTAPPPLSVMAETRLVVAAVNAARAIPCECRPAVNRDDNEAGWEPCDRCGALAFLRNLLNRPPF